MYISIFPIVRPRVKKNDNRNWSNVYFPGMNKTMEGYSKQNQKQKENKINFRGNIIL